MDEAREHGRDDVLIVIGSGNGRYREYLLAGAARERPLWLFDAAAPTWQKPHIAGFTHVDVMDPDALVAAARTLAAGRPVGGVFCYDEALVLPAAHVIEALGLPGMNTRTVRNCRDKGSTRKVLAEAGIPQPRSIAVATLEQARKEAALTGYPVVLKPRGLGASQGVVLVRDAGELETAYQAASSASYPGVPVFEDGVLVEEYLDGPEISVDAAVADGRCTPMFLARKELGPPPYFEETGHLIDPRDPLFGGGEVTGILAAVHAALGVERGMTHSELRLTSNGPRLVEVNARLGGDLIPYLGMLATGIDPGRVAARVAVGDDPRPAPTRSDTVGIRFLYPQVDSRVRGVDLPTAEEVAGLLTAQAIADPGTVLRLPPRGYVARHSYVICRGDGPAQCRERIEQAVARVELDYEVAPEFDPDKPDLSWLPAAARTGSNARTGDSA